MSNRRPLARAWRARHRPPVRWAAVAFLAILAVVRSESVVADADRARSDWGRTATVSVATHDLAPGTVIGAGDVSTATRPSIVVPTDAVLDAIGRSVTAPVAAGEVVLDRRLSNGGDGPAALLGPDDVAFAVPVDAATPPVEVGDHVDVFAPVDSASRSAVGATRVAHRAVITSVSDRAVTIGVDAESAVIVARSLLGASVVLALVD